MRSSKSRQLAGPTKKKILITLGMILIVLTSFFGGYFTQIALRDEGEAVVGDMLHIMDQVGFVYDSEKDEYVKLDEDKIAQLIAGNFLDGYSAYYTEEEYQAIEKQKAGSYSGFGFNMLNTDATSQETGTNVLNSVVLNSPAFNVGFRAGDKITKAQVVGGETYTITNGKQLSDFFDVTLKGQEVEFTVERGGEVLLEPLVCAKNDYVRSYVTYQDDENYAYFSPQVGERMVDVDDAYQSIVVKDGAEYAKPEFNVDTDGDGSGDIAYICITSFNGDVVEQFGAALEYMQARGRERLILDLCDNGGGSMSLFKEVSSYLMNKENCVIAKATEKLDGNDENGYFSDEYRTTNYVSGPNNFNENVIQIAVLANRNTASASECLINAMNSASDSLGTTGIYSKDNLVIVGSPNNYKKDDIPDDQIQYRTFGKGIMQTTYKLTSGGALKLTTAKLLTPNGKDCIHNKGIIANASNGVDSYAQAIARAIQILTPNQG